VLPACSVASFRSRAEVLSAQPVPLQLEMLVLNEELVNRLANSFIGVPYVAWRGLRRRADVKV